MLGAKQYYKQRSAQRGVALITVLLITALIALLVGGMLAQQRLLLKSTTHQLQQQRLWQLALSGESQARLLLQRVAKPAPKSETDVAVKPVPLKIALGQAWAQPSPPYQLEDGQIQIALEDLSARFDLNRVMHSDAVALQRYQTLLSNAKLPSQNILALRAMAAQSDGLLLDVSQLRLLKGMDAAALKVLRPSLVALDGRNAINVNTASASVLALLEPVSMAEAQALVAMRPAHGFDSVAQFMQSAPIKQHQIDSKGLSVDSRYFRATIDVRLDDARLRLVSDLYRANDGRVQTLRRDRSQSMGEQ